MFNNQFYSNRRPAFENLGTTFDQVANAVEAFHTMGPYKVEREQLFYNIRPQGFQPDTEKYFYDPEYQAVNAKSVLVGRFSEEGKEDKRYMYGIVDDRYELVEPSKLVEMWDMYIGRPVHTIGTFQQGKRFFITAKLDDFDILGDEHHNYITLISPHGTKESLICLQSPVRVYCMNMLHLAIKASEEYSRIPHRRGVTVNVANWLKEQAMSTTARTTEIKERLSVLASTQVGYYNTEKIVEKLFPYGNGVTDSSVEHIEKQTEARNDVVALFEGEAIGAETKAFKGTLYGLYQSVVEYCDYHKKGATRTGRFVGANAKLKGLAYDLLAKIAA